MQVLVVQAAVVMWLLMKLVLLVFFGKLRVIEYEVWATHALSTVDTSCSACTRSRGSPCSRRALP